MKRIISHLLFFIACIFTASSLHAQKKPNILIIMADDIGWFNTSAYNNGMMGYKTPNIDRIAKEGMRFTDAYGQQSCTAGRAAFITGQSPKRTGLLKIGMPGDPIGLQKEDPTIAEMLKPHGYVSGQFGKNHLGDLDKFLPTNHGFDEFFGNLYHLNAEEEPENADYPKGENFKKQYGPRGVLKSTADGKVEDTGPLTKKRMETIDQEFLDATINFIEKQSKAGKPFFCWFNTTRMHIFTHLPKEYDGKTGLGINADGYTQHDQQIGQLLDKLEELGLTENTIVIYTTDNGAEKFSWPDGGTSPFRGEKATTWEGGVRIPFTIRWPGKIEAGTVSNEIISLEDCLPTLVAAAGESDVKGKLLNGYQGFKVHIDGYNFLPYLTGKEQKGPRNEFFAFVDDGSLGAVRIGRWKFHFSTQEHEGLGAWIENQTAHKAPLLVDLYADPFELAMTNSSYYDDWVVRRMYAFEPLKNVVGKFMATFKDFPTRQEPGSFTPKQ
ncbi:arylsulfatase [Flavobacterium agrisoli]|uniref:Sulfatase-like hydrolase/transferase n=1 Tax=Flavobacterium agrisoli TaxID=2793066 RepID=A0A934PNA6_9FLAO|nr:arylsulfatase [Flavobacterium agrisoli]MBK0370058.1 sulfatase-like hydrolase/transferase [Flavobacterium agrisoli]